MGLIIHGIAASRAVRPLWAAVELGLDFTHVPTPYMDGSTRTADFLELNPNGHIPVLIDRRPEGEVVVWESMACALYLRWSFWVVNEVERDAITVLAHLHAMPEERRKPELALAAERRLAVPLRVLEQHLKQRQAAGQAWIAAGRFTVADLCVASVLNWVRVSRPLLGAHPVMHEWLRRCMERPAYLRVRENG
jgi:glutathione S-transferase